MRWRTFQPSRSVRLPPGRSPWLSPRLLPGTWLDCPVPQLLLGLLLRLSQDQPGEPAAAARLMTAVEQVCADGVLTADVGGTATTAQVTEAVIAAIRGANA